MKKPDHEQLTFIKQQYNLLSNSANKYFEANDLVNLNAERTRLGVFIDTIEKLFNCDFYTEIKPLF